MKKIKKLHLPLLVLITSVLSIVLIQQIVLAQAGRVTGNEFCFNPGETGDCVSDWDSIGGYWEESHNNSNEFTGIQYGNAGYGIGLGGGRAHLGYALSISDHEEKDVLKLNPNLIWLDSQDRDLEIKNVDFPDTDKGLKIEAIGGSLELIAPDWAGGTNFLNNVYTENGFGIGTAYLDQRDGNHLNIYDESTNYKNAELKIQSGGEPNDKSHWGIYHDDTTEDLIFWNNDSDAFSFKTAGTNYDSFFGVGTSTPLMSIHVVTSEEATRAGILLETDSGNNNYSWRIHNDYIHDDDPDLVVNDLSFGHYGNRDFLTLTRHGRVGIGTSTPMADLSIHEDDGNSLFDISAAGGYYGAGNVNLRLINKSTGWSIRSLNKENNDGNLHFSTLEGGYGGDNSVDEDVMVLSDTDLIVSNYLQVGKHLGGQPDDSDCSSDTMGRLILGYTAFESDLYICAYNNYNYYWHKIDL